MKCFITFVLCILLGFGIGWYCGYSSRATKHQELLKKYQRLEDVKRTDDWLLALFTTEAIKEVENAGTNQPERVAELTIVEYYEKLRPGEYNGWDVGDTNVIAQIQAAAKKYPAVGLLLAIPK
ncbi:MAG: hypothetical protein ABSE16_16815 [Verrucomicrobiota bacterium]|jgi:hypothetical protein